MEVLNFPNPFTDGTWFTFRHNQFGEDLFVEIQVFDFNGQLVTTIKPAKIVTNGYTIDPIYWDGTGSGGSKLNPGYYFYKIKVSNGIGYQTERIQKLIIMK
jgi:flagellar hook assembly protein FlgD